MFISVERLREGCVAFQKGEKRDAIYRTAAFLVEHFWQNPARVADGLGVLLLVWNNAHYRYASFDFDLLEKAIADHQETLHEFRGRNILSYTPRDDRKIGPIFKDFLEALKIRTKKGKQKRTPVGVAKALHMLAPGFFPLWDKAIAIAYDCDYSKADPLATYLKFFKLTKAIAEELAEKLSVSVSGPTLLKMIDEYNYALHTKKWIKPLRRGQ